MKKKILVCLFASFMVLTACGKASSKEELKDTFLEDTLLHEDVFDFNASRIKGVRNLDPVENSDPKIGIQYATSEGRVSIRYVAAINIPEGQLDNYSASWTRAVYDVDGSQRIASGSVDCTKVYAQLNGSNSTTVLPSSFGEGYNYFVVYTLRNVPADSFGGVLYASLTVNDGENDVASNYITTTLNIESNAIRTSLTSSDLAIDGYFLKGTIEGVAGSTRTGNDISNHLECFDNDLYLHENDSFVVAYKHDNTFKILNPSFDGAKNPSFTKDVDKGLINVPSTNLYHLHLSNDNLAIDFPTGRKLEFNSTNDDVSLTLYINTTDLSVYPWRWDIFNEDGGRNRASIITGKFLYVDENGNKHIYNDFNLLSVEAPTWETTFTSQIFTNSTKALFVWEALSFEYEGTTFTVDAQTWRDTIVGPELRNKTKDDLENLAKENPRVTKANASFDDADGTYNLYLYVFSTTNPSGFVWPTTANPVYVYGTYIMTNGNGIVNFSRFKYRYGGVGGQSWSSHFESSGTDSVTSEQHNNGLIVVLGNYFNFTIDESDWKMAVLNLNE